MYVSTINGDASNRLAISTTNLQLIGRVPISILSICNARRAECKAWYFDIYFRFKIASMDYRAGKPNVVFPPGTFSPHLPCKPAVAAEEITVSLQRCIFRLKINQKISPNPKIWPPVLEKII